MSDSPKRGPFSMSVANMFEARAKVNKAVGEWPRAAELCRFAAAAWEQSGDFRNAARCARETAAICIRWAELLEAKKSSGTDTKQ